MLSRYLDKNVSSYMYRAVAVSQAPALPSVRLYEQLVMFRTIKWGVYLHTVAVAIREGLYIGLHPLPRALSLGVSSLRKCAVIHNTPHLVHSASISLIYVQIC